jgi:hypothetical protein
MKRILAALFLALVVALVGTIGVASAAPPHDFTTGGGKVVTTFTPDSTRVEKFAFSAHAIGSTTGARGHYVYEETHTFPEVPLTVRLELKGSVDCVRVVDNGASFSGRIEKTNDPSLVGSFAIFDVVDNDQPRGNGADPDQFLFGGTSASSTCHPIPLPGNPLSSGNIVVNNGQ